MTISFEFLQLITYFIFVFSIIAYSTLDGFDLGVGTLHLFTKGDNERRIMINSIGPVWDGNTTWIVIGSGVLFAGFPKVFANLTSSLYTPTMVLLFGFMLRAASIEFRSKGASKTWRYFWDFAFSLASILLAITIGLILGNMIQGMPLNDLGEYEGGMIELLTPYPILIALFGISMFTMHGSIYVLMKTEGPFQEKIRKWTHRILALFLFFWAFATISTFIFKPYMVVPFFRYPILFIFPTLSLGSIFFIVRNLMKKRDGWAFFSSCFCIVFLLLLFIIGTFPNIVYSSVLPETNSMTLYNSSASHLALIVIAIIGLTGIPLSFFYGSYVYKVFRGKVKIDKTSY
ncbi:MAG: cytochrome d ubiquinol oxidase subunit II [Chlamydiae bacterium]|nr:cytochrome d ubiquinol oxidase subunit II [Chlamydiota bacterium]